MKESNNVISVFFKRLYFSIGLINKGFCYCSSNTVKLIGLSLCIVFIISCGQKKKLNPKYDATLYERIDVNFYKGKTDGKIYIRTAEMINVKDSGQKSVYYFKEVPNIDLASFKDCGQGHYYAKDKNNVYTWEITPQGEDLLVLEGVDPTTFTSFAHHWAKDTNAVYFERTKLPKLNPQQIKPVCYELGTDSITMYIKYIRDNENLYLMENEIKPAQGIDISLLSCKDDLFGNSFLEYKGELYILENGQMKLYR